jgi:hypothetical protein
LLEESIADQKLFNLLVGIIHSFEMSPGKGMPLGNLTSQLFANVYMDPLDKFVKHQLKAPYYLRYADDFLLLSNDLGELLGYFVEINSFLKKELKLAVHPDKIYLRKLEWGIDFVGYVARPYYEMPRKKTVKRIRKELNNKKEEDLEKMNATLQSNLGYLKHVSAYKVYQELISLV